jgi:DNA helicase-2/ATP-dependent DNA helicase PcrA
MPTYNLSGIDSGQAPEPAPSAPIKWSPQQIDVFHAVTTRPDSLQVEAVAGSGKTTTLVHAASLMTGPTAFCAFNKKIADEIKARTRSFPHVTAGTLHSFGLKSWKQTAPTCEIDKDKVENICEDLAVPFYMRAFTKFMVEACKNNAWKYPVDYDQLSVAADHFDAYEKLPDSFDLETEDAFQYVNPVLNVSIQRADEIIDFSDMLYMPLCYGHITPEYSWVLVDEAQDTNYTRRSLVARMLAPAGRVLAVGDRHQSIYGFTGADSDAMDLIASEFQCHYLPLTVTYRCPRKVVEHAHQWVSHIEAHESAPEGVVRELDARAWDKLSGEHFTPADVILCRNTAPLISQALTMIRRGIGARVEGRDIGQSLQALANRWKSIKTLSALTDKLEEHRLREGNKLRSRGQRQKAAQVEDKVDSLIAVIHSLPPKATTWDLSTRITTLFGDTEPGQTPKVCTLSTIHKAKGREWDRVYLYGRRELQPSKWAKQEWELQQERNLCYVAVTRAKRELVEVEYVG